MLALFALFVDTNSDYIKYIYDYGPAALVVFVSVVLLAFSASQLRTNPNGIMERRIYISNWLAIGVLVVAATVIWAIQNLGQQAPIRGRIGTLPAKYLVRAPLNDDDMPLYVHAEYEDRNRDTLTYHWIMAPKDFRSVPKQILIEVYEQLNPSETSGYDKKLQLDVKKGLHGQAVVIQYDVKSGKYSLLHEEGQDGLALNELDASAAVPPIDPQGDRSAVVYATTVFDPSAMKTRLESGDPGIRRDARVDLAKRLTEAQPSINEWLVDPNSSLSLLLGVLSALGPASKVPIEVELAPAALQRVIELTLSPNADVSKAASDVLSTHGTQAVHVAIFHWLTANKGKRRINDMAIADMDILYNLGIHRKDMYGGHKDKTLFASAQDAFSQGWEDRSFAENADQVYFAKALYGWGLLLADKAVLEKNSDGSKKPEYVRAAQSKFRDFLAAANRGPYPEGEQVRRAQAYLLNPAMSPM